MYRLRSLCLLLAVLGAAIAAAPTSASATTLCVSGTTSGPCPAGHPGGAFTLTSTNLTWAYPGGSLSFLCTDSTISGTAPTTSATTLSIPVTLSVGGCALFTGSISVTVPPACQATGATPIRLNVMYNQATAPQASLSLTLPAGCTITTLWGGACDIAIAGPQTLGQVGMSWTNGSATTSSSMDLATAVVPMADGSGAPACPTNGTRGATMTGTFRVSTPFPAPGVTVIP
jgi:hypothetical protein